MWSISVTSKQKFPFVVKWPIFKKTHKDVYAQYSKPLLFKKISIWVGCDCFEQRMFDLASNEAACINIG